MRYALILTILAALALPGLATAQEPPPLPRPRPERIGVDSALQALSGAEGTARQAIDQVLAGTPQPASFSARIGEDGPLIPTGLIWRIYDTTPDDSGQLPLRGKSTDPTATFNLPPGEYVAHVAYGQAQATETFTVQPGTPRSEIMILEAGALRLDAVLTGDIDIPDNLLRFEIYPDGAENDERARINGSLHPGEIIHLNAGIYHVVSYYGDLNAVVRNDLRVEPGKLTDATLYQNAARVNLRLVSETGGEAIADVEWLISDLQGHKIVSDVGAFPSAILAEGDYTARAQLGPNVYARDFTVKPAATMSIEVLTTSDKAN